MKRSFGPDAVRAAAAVGVLSVHFYLNSGFYELPVAGGVMTASTALRMAFLTAVPMFLMLSGWLCCHQTWTPRYYLRLLPVLLTYLVCSAGCLVFRRFYLGEEIVFLGALRRILEFSAAPYSWYIEMYIGLFLLQPLLNAGFSALPERGKLALTVSLFAITSLPLVTNSVYHILPAWWTNFYPVAYYILGAYLREKPLRCRSGWLWLGWLGVAAVHAAVQRWLYPGEPMVITALVSRGGPGVFVESLCLFSLLMRSDDARAPRAWQWIVRRIAALSLPMYLLSYITDRLLYPRLAAAVPDGVRRQLLLPLAVLLNLVGSGVLAQLCEWLTAGLQALLPQKWKYHSSGSSVQAPEKQKN